MSARYTSEFGLLRAINRESASCLVISWPKPLKKTDSRMMVMAGVLILVVFLVDLLADTQFLDPGIKR